MTRRKNNYRPSLEGLEARLVLSTITWNGNGDDQTFSSGANWVGGVAPGTSDDAVINVSSGVTIQLPNTGVTVHSLTQTGGTLTFQAGVITTTTGLNLTNCTFNDNGGAIFGGATLTNSTLNTQATSGTAQFTIHGASTVNGEIPANLTLTVQGESPSNAVLTLDTTTFSLATIVLQSASGSTYSSDLVIASGTTYANTGTIQVDASAVPSTMTGSFDNSGAINVAAGATVITGGTNQTFTQETGSTLDVASTGTFIDNAGTFVINGGTVSGNVEAQGCSVGLTSSVTSATTIYAVGGNGNTTLITNDTPLGTVVVQGNNADGNSTLTVAAGAVNYGAIVLESAAESDSTSNVVVASGSTFYNDGAIHCENADKQQGLSGSVEPCTLIGSVYDTYYQVSSSVMYSGSIDVDMDCTLIVNAGSPNLTVTASKYSSLSASGILAFDGGTLNVNGGGVGGNVEAQGCSFAIDTAATIYAVGGNGPSTLITNLALTPSSVLPDGVAPGPGPGVVVVEGNNTDGNATLIVASGALNYGSIMLAPATGSDSTSNVVVASGSTFDNDGTISCSASAEPSTLTGNVYNTEFLYDNQSYSNYSGTVEVNTGATLIVNANSPGLTFTSNAGSSLSASGALNFDGGTFLVNGGTLSGNVDAQGCMLDMALSISTATTVYAVGGNGPSTLVSNDAYAGTVWVQGNSTDGNATLVLANNANNIGTIELQSASGSSATSNLAAASGTTFTNTGIVQVNPSSGATTIGGGFDNRGKIQIASGATLIAGTAGLTFTQDLGGSLAATGTFLANAGTFLVDGGIVSGTVEAQGCSLQLAATITLATTIDVIGGNGTTTLISNSAPLGTVTVEGNNNNGSSTLTLAAGASNLGTIVLQSGSGSGYTSNLAVASGSTFVNAGTVEVNASNVASYITGNFDNTGNLAIPGGGDLIVGSAGGTFTLDVGGTVTANGALACVAGTLLINGGALTGPVQADGCSLQLASTITSPTTVDVIGANGNTTLISNNSAFGTIVVQGSDFNGNSTLVLASGASNVGTIVLQPYSGSAASSNLAVASGSTFTNAGMVLVDPSSAGSTLNGNFDNSGTLEIAGASLTLAGAGTSLVNMTGGVVNAWGTLNDSATSFTNNGTLSVDTGAGGSLAISGTYTQTSTGALSIELGGTTAGTSYDQLNVSGTASLAGSINFALINSFTPNPASTFTVMTFGSASGTFATDNGTNLMDGLTLNPSQSSTALTLSITAGPSADLAVTVVAQPLSVTIGGTVTYLVTVTNNGPSTASGVVLTDNLPAGVPVNSIMATSGTVTTSGNTATVNISSIADGGQVVVTIVTTPSATGTIVDSATVVGTISYDSNTSNNSASASSTVNPLEADLAVGVTAQPAQVNVGGQITYVVTVTNNGPYSSQGVVLVNTLPSGVSVVSITPSAGTYTTSGGTVTLDVASVADNAFVTLTLIVTPSGPGKHIDSASVSETSPVDPNLTNNSGSATSSVVGTPSSVTANAGSSQGTVVGTAFAMPFQALVEDQYGDPISGVIVTFTAPASGPGGSFAVGRTTTVTTNASGLATSPAFTAGTLAGSYAVNATISGVSTPASFSLSNNPGAASSIVSSAGTPQTTKVGTGFTTALQALVSDQFGNPVSGVSVTFAAPASGPSGGFSGVTTTTVTTNSLGEATAPAFTAGKIAGSYAVTATVSGVSTPASFSLSNTVGAVSSITATAGTPQSTVVGTAFASALQATVSDQYGNPITGVSVTFTAPSSGAGGVFAGVGTTTVTTNALGVASAPAFTAGKLVGIYSVVATVSSLSSSASFSLSNTAGAASSIKATAGASQSAMVGTSFATAFQATVVDQYGNPVPGAMVTFTAPAGALGGSFATGKSTTATTNALGVASAPAFTAGTSAGGYSVVATVSGVSSSASFSLTNTAGSASSITATAGTSQTALANVVFGTPMQVTVDDQYGNPVSGVSVTFAAPASGTSGNFAGVKTATATTNALGVASAPAFTAGKLAGSYSVLATVSGVSSSASFSLTNTEMTSTTLNVTTSLVPIAVPETLTATVAPVAPALTTPTGSVSFYDGSKLLGSATLNSSGQAVLTISTLAYGAHSITASYAGIPTESTSASQTVPVRVGDTVSGDFDGDGKSDIAIFDQTTATFNIQYSGGGTRTQQLGNPADKNIPVAGDFTGDGKDDLAIYDQTQAIFYILYSNGGSLALPFGNKNHVNIPVAGDYDGTGKTDIAIFDQTASIFYILYSNGGSLVQPYGNPAHVNIPVAGSFDGSGKTNIAIYDQTAATFYVLETLGKTVIQPLGNASHVNVPIAADYDGDGKTDFAVYDQTAGIFYALESGGGTIAQPFGNPADGITPLVGDFTGDGKTDIGIYDATNGEFFILYSNGGSLAMPFGNNKHKNLPV